MQGRRIRGSTCSNMLKGKETANQILFLPLVALTVEIRFLLEIQLTIAQSPKLHGKRSIPAVYARKVLSSIHALFSLLLHLLTPTHRPAAFQRCSRSSASPQCRIPGRKDQLGNVATSARGKLRQHANLDANGRNVSKSAERIGSN